MEGGVVLPPVRVCKPAMCADSPRCVVSRKDFVVLYEINRSSSLISGSPHPPTVAPPLTAPRLCLRPVPGRPYIYTPRVRVRVRAPLVTLTTAPSLADTSSYLCAPSCIGPSGAGTVSL